MTPLAKLQCIGPFAVTAAIVGADGAAIALDKIPASTILWRVNLEWFGIFQQSHYFTASFVDIAHAEVVLIALPLLTLALAGIALRTPLAIGIAGNLSCTYAAFLLYVWCFNAYVSEFSLATWIATVNKAADADLLVCLILLGATLPSFAASHILYIARLSKNPDA
jgi:hypothetical protein